MNKYEFRFLFLFISKRFKTSCPEEYAVLQNMGSMGRMIQNRIMGRFEFRGPNCVFVCSVKLKVAVL
jgi:hypothetical protein